MADSCQFLSICTPATADGTISMILQSYNSVPTNTYTDTFNISKGQSEQAIAIAMLSQMQDNLLFDGLNYNGMPVFSDQTPQGTWQPYRSDHVLSIWSESQFSLTVDTGTTGVAVRQGTTPMLLTLAQCQTLGPRLNQFFTDSVGNPMTKDQILDLILMACAECTSYLHNPIVTRTWEHEEIGTWTQSIFLKKRPIVDWDAPVIRRPNMFNVLPVNTFADVVTRYAVNRQTGEVEFRFAQNLLFNYEPFDYNNDVKMSYRAGWHNIPEIVQQIVIQLSKLYERVPGVLSLGGGTSKMEFEKLSEQKKALMAPLIEYALEAIY